MKLYIMWTLKGSTFNETMKNLEEHIRKEHEPGDDEHLTELIANYSQTADHITENYTEIFNHIAQEINFVENSLSNLSSIFAFQCVILLFFAIKWLINLK